VIEMSSGAFDASDPTLPNLTVPVVPLTSMLISKPFATSIVKPVAAELLRPAFRPVAVIAKSAAFAAPRSPRMTLEVVPAPDKVKELALARVPKVTTPLLVAIVTPSKPDNVPPPDKSSVLPVVTFKLAKLVPVKSNSPAVAPLVIVAEVIPVEEKPAEVPNLPVAFTVKDLALLAVMTELNCVISDVPAVFKPLSTVMIADVFAAEVMVELDVSVYAPTLTVKAPVEPEKEKSPAGRSEPVASPRLAT